MTSAAKSSSSGSSIGAAAIILLLLFPLMTRSFGLPGQGGSLQSRKLIISNPERETPSGPDDPEQYRMKHRTKISACGGSSTPAPSSSNNLPAAAAVVAQPDRDVPNGPEDPYSSRVKEMSSCWKPHGR